MRAAIERIDQLVSEFAHRTPDHLAIEGGGVSVTYAELERLANQFAHVFRSSGLQSGDRIGLHLQRSGRGVAAMLGAARIGAVYVPLDPGSPPARMKLIALDCGLRHVVISPGLLANWIAAGAREPIQHFIMSADGEVPALPGPARVVTWAEVTAASDSALPAPDRRHDDLAYILYTSGSTGVPKGVMISHRNALAFTEWTADRIQLGPGDHVASVAPFHFDLSVFDIWASLSRGASVFIVDEATVINGRRMLDRIRDKAISVWYSVPSALVLMLEAGGLAERGAPSLRVVFFAGEVFPMKQLRRTMEALPQARFWNLFGPTETNVCTAYELPGIPDELASAIPIGFASCGDSAVIVDEAGVPVPEGETGELLIEGPTVMLGYWNGGHRTPAKHPFPTGDLVSRRADGALMYHGRRDHMVKIHGYRVELGEVEAALLEHASIREAIAFAHGQKLVAVIVPADPDVSVLGVKRHCVQHLPRYMIPTDIRLVPALPRTSSGKIDRVRAARAVVDGDVFPIGSVPPADSPG